MAKVLATEIRVGHLLEWEKRIWRVLKCYHVHVGGRGGAFMQVEMKDIEAGTKTNQRFRTEDKVERAFVEPREMTFSYHDGDNYVFMDKENYEELRLSAEFLEGQSGYLLPEMEVQVNFYNGRPIGLQLPPSVILTVSDTEPGITDRFELFIGGKELANGFSELNDPEDQAARFQAQVDAKDAGDDEEASAFDERSHRTLDELKRLARWWQCF